MGPGRLAGDLFDILTDPSTGQFNSRPGLRPHGRTAVFPICRYLYVELWRCKFIYLGPDLLLSSDICRHSLMYGTALPEALQNIPYFGNQVSKSSVASFPRLGLALGGHAIWQKEIGAGASEFYQTR